MTRNWGGRRKGAGRKPVLKDVSLSSYNLSSRHLEALEKYSEWVSADSRSQALRGLLSSLRKTSCDACGATLMSPKFMRENVCVECAAPPDDPLERRGGRPRIGKRINFTLEKHQVEKLAKYSEIQQCPTNSRALRVLLDSISVPSNPWE